MAKQRPAKPAKKTDRAAILANPARPPLFPAPQREDLLSTGCTVLNVALSGFPEGGVAPGTYVYYVGDSGADKTWLALSLFAEAARNPRYADYRFVLDNAENGALMDVARYFGSAVEGRLEAPSAKQPGSRLVQEFYYHVEAAVERGPCIYVLDSMDALQDLADEENFEAERHFFETGKGEKDIKGTMGMNKAKNNSRNINRTANVTLRTNGSILVVISQTRDKANAAYAGQKTRSGGHALKFFAHVEIWTRVREALTKAHKDKDREYGKRIEAAVHKNRMSGWHGKVPLIDHLSGYGIDDVGTSIKYLIDEKHWKFQRAENTRGRNPDEEKLSKVLDAPEFGFVGTVDQLAMSIQDSGREAELGALVASVWDQIRAAVAPHRKPRY